MSFVDVLPGGAHDRDDACVALRADERGECGEGRLLVVGDERGGSSRRGVGHVRHTGVQRDEEIAWADCRESALIPVIVRRALASGASSAPSASATTSSHTTGITQTASRRTRAESSQFVHSRAPRRRSRPTSPSGCLPEGDTPIDNCPRAATSDRATACAHVDRSRAERRLAQRLADDVAIVERRRLRRPISWPCSCPLPAITTTSPGSASATARSDRAPPVRIDLDARPGALQHVLDDRERILAARVVGGDDDEVGAPHGDGTHHRPLAAVAVASRAEDADQPPARRARGPPGARCRASRACARSRR